MLNMFPLVESSCDFRPNHPAEDGIDFDVVMATRIHTDAELKAVRLSSQ